MQIISRCICKHAVLLPNLFTDIAIKRSVSYEGKSSSSMPWLPGADLGSGQIVLDRTKFIGSCFIFHLFFKCSHYVGQVPIVNYFYVPNSFSMKQTNPLRILH